MTREEAIKDKRKALAECTMQIAGEMMKLVLMLVPRRKKLFQKKNRSPLRKNKMIVERAIQAHRVEMSQLRFQMIMSQPIPNYIKGGDTSNGIAMVGIQSKEIIINRGGKEICTSNYITGYSNDCTL